MLIGYVSDERYMALHDVAVVFENGGEMIGTRSLANGAPLRKGKVTLVLPQLADNGNSVPIRITVDSPMTPADHVKSIHLYSERNPVPNMANFYLSPRAGRAEINSRVRLAGSQRVTAVAKLSDGSFWYAAAPIVVTLSACLDES